MQLQVDVLGQQIHERDISNAWREEIQQNLELKTRIEALYGELQSKSSSPQYVSHEASAEALFKLGLVLTGD
jgi:hypothetical protein